jgi:Holliday junction DNA helicase RuvB
VGKSLLARALAAEMGTKVTVAMGYSDKAALADKLGHLEACDFLLIDECHRLGYPEQELLCELIDADSIPAPEARRAATVTRVAIPPRTLVLATDRPGRLLDALHKRMVVDVALGYYAIAELKEITATMASQIGILLSPQGAKLIAEATGGLPRRARHFLANLRYYYADSGARELGKREILEYFEAAGVDATGLGPQEVSYLRVLDRLGTASLESIALALGDDPDFVRRRVEPTLVRRGLAEITLSGRRLTQPGRLWIQGHPQPEEAQP